MKLGKAFFDNVEQRSKRASRPKGDGVSAWWLGNGRVLLFSVILYASFFILVVRLFHLTVIRGHEYRVLADGNRIRELTRHAPRGILLDRTGKPLVSNVPEFRLLHPCSGDEPKRPVCIERVSKERGEELTIAGLPSGSFLEVDYQRQYLFPTSMSHVIGYAGEISETELTDEYYVLRGYKPRDKVGRMGIEAVYDERLRGRDGKELVEVDATGKILRTLGRQEEVPGEDIQLSLDARISEAVERSFPEGKKGAVIVSKPFTGEILALYSSPTFSNNLFSLGMTEGEYARLMENADRPMFNRSIGGVYPPGSTFKLVTSIAGLEEKAFTRETTVEDTGVIKIGEYEFPNWFYIQYGRTDGIVDVVRSLARSNDIFFYKAGEWIGITKLGVWAEKAGLGKPLGIELPGEAGGLIPGPNWKDANFSSELDRQMRNNLWYLGDTYHVSIGQGYLLSTPLQVNSWTNIVANGGRLCRPTIKKFAFDQISHNQDCVDLNIQPETLRIVEQGMIEACETGGTGWPLFGFGVHRTDSDAPDASASGEFIRIPVACKTGTAEYGDPNDNTHASFTAYAPVRAESVREGSDQMITGEPEISVTVLVEEAGQGSDVAAPVAKAILEEWFRQ